MDSRFYAPHIGMLKCSVCGEVTKIKPFIHDQSNCPFYCYELDLEEPMYQTMHTTSWPGWMLDRRTTKV